MRTTRDIYEEIYRLERRKIQYAGNPDSMWTSFYYQSRKYIELYPDIQRKACKSARDSFYYPKKPFIDRVKYDYHF